MTRTYTKMLPLWFLETKLKLSDKYPSGLEWIDKDRNHKPGDMAGIWKSKIKRYILHITGDFIYAHRVVYYLRTGEDPGNKDVLHLPNNPERDNRKELILFERKTVKPPTRRNRRRSDYASDYVS
jgi:hypothetical protein